MKNELLTTYLADYQKIYNCKKVDIHEFNQFLWYFRGSIMSYNEECWMLENKFFN